MPTRTMVVDGSTWEVFPSGLVTQSDRDEFAVMFVRRGPEGAARQVRVTRYSPQGARSRAESLAELDAAALQRLFDASQPSATSPEAGYAR